MAASEMRRTLLLLSPLRTLSSVRHSSAEHKSPGSVDSMVQVVAFTYLISA